MTWIPLERLLLETPTERVVSFSPKLNFREWQQQVLTLAGGLGERNVRCIAIHLEDAVELSIALLGAWRAGVQVLLPSDLQGQTRERWAARVDIWLTDQPGDTGFGELVATPLAPAALDLTTCHLGLCTSGSSGEAKLIDKHLGQLANEVNALENLWGAELGRASLIASVAAQHIYGLLFRVLWPLCAGRPFARRQLAFPEDLQRASLEHPSFAWVASPALLKRMGNNLDWPALAGVRRVFSSGGALPAEAAAELRARLGQWPTEIFGSSETGGIAWRQGSTPWQPFAGVELSLNEHSALRVASAYLPAGHIEQTADAATLHADGRFELLGRLDRIVKLEEKRISLPSLETALLAHEWVSEARLGVVQEGRAYLGALLVLSDAGLKALCSQGRRALTEQLRQHLNEHCEALALPRRWRLLSHLPFNSQGKLPQAEVDALLAAARPREPQLLGQRQEEQQLILELRVPPDLAHFSGHFPHAPVLPGVVQVDWAIALGQALLDLPPRFAGMEVLKFQQLVRPGDHLELALSFDASRSKLHFAFRRLGVACSSGRILLEPEHA